MTSRVVGESTNLEDSRGLDQNSRTLQNHDRACADTLRRGEAGQLFV